MKNEQAMRKRLSIAIGYTVSLLHWIWDLTIQRLNDSTWRSHSSFLIRHFALAIWFALSLPLYGQSPASAKDILDSVRMVETRQQIDLQGQLRQDDIMIPFRLVQNGPLIRYSFTSPDETLQLRLGENNSRLYLVDGGNTEKF